jgi:hypothetical protein
MNHSSSSSKKDRHPAPELLERFMRDEAEPAERRWVVRHLIAGCSRCLELTSKLWALGDPPIQLQPHQPSAEPRGRRPGTDAGTDPDPPDLADPRQPAASAPASTAARPGGAYDAIFDRLAGAGRRVQQEREQAPRLVAELLAGSPAERAAQLAQLAAIGPAGAPGPSGQTGSAGVARSAGPAGEPESGGPAGSADSGGSAGSGGRAAGETVRQFAVPAVCELLLDRSREAAAADAAGNAGAGSALQLAEMALAIAERLDPALCGESVALGLRARAWAHLGHARRLGGDLEGAEWALATAEVLVLAEVEPDEATATGGSVGPLGLEPQEWAQLLVFKAGLFADRGYLGEADRLLERAAELHGAAGEPQGAGRALLQQASIQAEMGDGARAADLLRAAVELLDLASQPRQLAGALCRLAALLCGAPGATAAAPTAPGSISLRSAAVADNAGSAADVAGDAVGAGPLRGEPRGSLNARCAEALQLAGRAQAIYAELDDPASQARLSRLLGQIEAAMERLDAAEATLLAACAALTRHGLGREAALAQLELALVLARQERADEVHRLGLLRRPLVEARDKRWNWYAGLLVFQNLRASEPASPGLLLALVRYLAGPFREDPAYPARRRLSSVA